MTTSLIAVGAFIEAFRDAGYRGLPGALSELLDNSLEASATRMDIRIGTAEYGVEHVIVQDNGCGIPASGIPSALQFGGSTRFDDRLGFGRYGLGLPGSSISQARRVEVFSWVRPGDVWFSYFSLDEIRAGTLRSVPPSVRKIPPISIPTWAAKNGTIVLWTACDRISRLSRSDYFHLRDRLGRTFREALWAGRAILLNGDPVKPVDPLFLRDGTTPAAAKAYGPPLQIDVDIPGRGRRRRAAIEVKFSELPIKNWHDLANAEKRRLGIIKGGGVSVLRAGREIDTGWYFMGAKRRESYDDWWRCEISFAPELDEFFGVTHTKQGIHPTALLESILTPHLERTAHELNHRVRQCFQRLRHGARSLGGGARVAEQRDHLLEPPKASVGTRIDRGSTRGIRYRIDHQPLKCLHFFRPRLRGNFLSLTFNNLHPFHAAVFRHPGSAIDAKVIELLILAAARAEWRLRSAKDRAAVARHREHWSNALAAFFG